MKLFDKDEKCCKTNKPKSGVCLTAKESGKFHPISFNTTTADILNCHTVGISNLNKRLNKKIKKECGASIEKFCALKTRVEDLEDEVDSLFDTIVTCVCYRSAGDATGTYPRSAFKHVVLDPLTGDPKMGHPKAEMTMSGSTVYFTEDMVGEPIPLAQIEGVTSCGAGDCGTGTVEFNLLVRNLQACSSDHVEILPDPILDINTSISLGPNPGSEGFISATRPDGTILGGDCRGINAVDWQIVRDDSNRVAAGNISVISGGRNNAIGGSATGAAIVGGLGNGNYGNYGFMGGGYGNLNNSTGMNGVLVGGRFNYNNALGGTVVGGANNTNVGEYGFIGGGTGNYNSGNPSVICGGRNNTNSAANSVIVGGISNNSSGKRNFIGGGFYNKIDATGSVVVGGEYNTIYDKMSGIVGGQFNQILSSYSTDLVALNGENFIGGGSNNIINENCHSGVITGGRNNINSQYFAFIGGGVGNTIGKTGSSSLIVGGLNNMILSQTSRAVVVGGTNNRLQGNDSIIVGGDTNSITGNFNSLLGGSNNLIEGNLHSLVGGTGNKMDGTGCFIGGGVDNTIVSSISNADVFSKNVIGGGEQNYIYGSLSAIVGGYQNSINSGNTGEMGTQCFIGGGYNNKIYTNYASIVSGRNNKLGTGSSLSSIINGSSNVVNNSTVSTIINGLTNTIKDASYSVISGGTNNNVLTGKNSFIGAGDGNISSGTGSFIGSGKSNNDTGVYNGIVSGENNYIYGKYCFVGGGKNNSIITNYSTGYNNSILGGLNNNIDATYSSICGGANNTITQSYCGTLGGRGLEISGPGSSSFARAVVGQFNLETTGPSGSDLVNQRIFTVGNGTGTGASRSNAFSVDLNGQAFAPGGFFTSGADFAEYLESLDGNEIPVGSTVALEDGKIRLAKEGDDVIGAISVRPTVVGNDFQDHWHGKYEIDQWGQLVYEDISYLNFSYKKPKISKDYDPNKAYEPRSKRIEWHKVALVGQVRIRKDSVKGERWMKMKDINEEVELWLIR